MDDFADRAQKGPRRGYGDHAAWVTRMNRPGEPARPAEPTRLDGSTRYEEPARQLDLPRP